MNELIREIYRFFTLRILFPFYYRVFSKRTLKKKKAVFVESQHEKLSNSMKLLYETLQEDPQWELSVHCLRESFVSRGQFILLALQCLRDIADAEVIVLCEASRLVSCLPKRKGTRVVQLWHGCGAFKKFGMSTADLLFGSSRRNYEKYPYHANLDYVTVSSPEVVWAYEEAMNIPKGSNIVRPIGISRTDIFYQEAFLSQARTMVEKEVPECRGKKILLYAPTFRGNVNQAQAPDQLDISALMREFKDEYVLIIMHHPYVKKRPEIPEEAKGSAFDLTGKLGIEVMICVSDICISDYSSLIFEYSLFERPMIFFAYDLKDYDDWRGFYYDYDTLTPGPVFKTTQEIISYIKQIQTEFDPAVVKAFREKFMSSCDGKATKRLVELLSGTEER